MARFLASALVGLLCWLTVTAFSPSSLSAKSALRACLLPPPACKAIVVLSPHPDDETLGFGGLIRESLQKGKAVWIIEATSGDAYEGACRIWNMGRPCTSEDLLIFSREREKEVIRSLTILGGRVRVFKEPPHLKGRNEQPCGKPQGISPTEITPIALAPL